MYKEMIIKNPSDYLQEGDIESGKEVKFLTEGLEKTSQWGKTVYEFEIELADGAKKKITLNKTSLKFMLKTFGKESKEWVGKLVPVFFIKAMIAGKQKTVCYVGEIPTDDNSSSDAEDVDVPEFLQ
jgi:hypothetical protein